MADPACPVRRCRARATMGEACVEVHRLSVACLPNYSSCNIPRRGQDRTGDPASHRMSRPHQPLEPLISTLASHDVHDASHVSAAAGPPGRALWPTARRLGIPIASSPISLRDAEMRRAKSSGRQLGMLRVVDAHTACRTMDSTGRSRGSRGRTHRGVS